MDPLPIVKLYKDEEAKLPVFLDDNAGLPATGLPSWAIAARYVRKSDVVFQTFSPDGTQWEERGDGLYILTLPSTVPDEEGLFALVVEPPASGYPAHRQYGHIDRRVEDYVREATVTGGAALNTIERAIYDAGNRYEAFGVPMYNFDDGKLDVICFLARNGQRVTDPTSCSFELRDKSDIAEPVVSSGTSSSPNSDGIFAFLIDPQSPALEGKKVYSLKVEIVHEGVTYRSIQGSVSFN